MRLPVTPSLSTRDGISAKNARLTNCLKESKQGGDKAVIRPGLKLSDTYSGLGSGLIVFDGRLLVIYDDTVTDIKEDSFPWPLDSAQWAAGTTYGFGDAVWYLGNLWFSASGSNTGNTPGTGTSWRRSYEIPAWDSGTTYAIGDPVDYNGTRYYSLAPSNTNKNPASTPVWSTSAPGTSRYRANITTLGLTGAGNPGAECASAAAAAFSAYSTATAMISCATKNVGTQQWYSYVGIEVRPGFGTYVRATQYVDPVPNNCSGTPTDMGTIDIGTVTQTV